MYILITKELQPQTVAPHMFFLPLPSRAREQNPVRNTNGDSFTAGSWVPIAIGHKAAMYC